MENRDHESIQRLARYGLGELRRTSGFLDHTHFLVLLGLVLLKYLSERSDVTVPEQSRWETFAKVSDVALNLDHAVSALRAENPAFAEYFAGVQFVPTTLVSQDARAYDESLRRLIWGLSELRSGEIPLLFDELVKAWTELTSRSGDASSEPLWLAELLVQIMQPEAGHRVCDPTCGIGVNLVACARHVTAKTGRLKGLGGLDLTLHGQEINPFTRTICAAHLLINDVPNARVECGDIITEPKLVENGRLLQYDRVLMSPPFGHKLQHIDVLENDPYLRFGGGRSVRGEAVFIEHAIAILADRGRAGIFVPHGILFRDGNDARLRTRLLEEDLLEAVVGLPSGLYGFTNIAIVMLIINRKKTSRRREQVLFVDASEDYGSQTGKNWLREADIERIANAYSGWRDESGYCRIVTSAEIESNGLDMSVRSYVGPEMRQQDGAAVEVNALLSLLEKAERERDAANARMDALIARVGQGQPKSKAKSKRSS